MMKFKFKKLLALTCTAAFLLGSAMNAHAAEDLSQPIRIHGSVISKGDNSLTIDNQASASYVGEMVLHTDDTQTRILDAVSGLPAALSDIQDGSFIYAYISPVMALSLPPQTSAEMILCNIPADFRVPDYIQVESMVTDGDNTFSLKATNGKEYSVPGNCSVNPYLTRNIVTLADVTAGKTCLVYEDEDNEVYKIILFAGSAQGSGWTQELNNWVYYKEDGTRHTGWLLYNGDWYYFDPATAVMVTGFVTVDGNTYYMQEDGRMLTSAKTFVPDANGILR